MHAPIGCLRKVIHTIHAYIVLWKRLTAEPLFLWWIGVLRATSRTFTNRQFCNFAETFCYVSFEFCVSQWSYTSVLLLQSSVVQQPSIHHSCIEEVKEILFLGTNSDPVEAQQTIQSIYATHVSVLY